MSYKISDACASCGSCAAECPNQAISEGDSQYQIDPSKCTECVGFFNEAQCASTCPCEAISLENPETEEALKNKLKTMYPDKDFSGKIPSHFA